MASVRFELRSGDASTSFLMDDCDGLDHVVSQARERGLAHYEAPYPSFVSSLVGALPGAMLDIGANTGLYALLAAGVRPDIRVHAFEPLASIADRLQNNIALNPKLADNISVHRLALSDAVGEATFFETINPYGLFTTSSSLDEMFAKQHAQVNEHRVPITTLDAWVAEHNVTEVSFIKIDVEGHEREVLAGGQDALARLRPVIGIELLGPADFDYFRRFIDGCGYVDCSTQPDSITFNCEPRFVAEGWNHLFVPVERIGLVAQAARKIGMAIARL